MMMETGLKSQKHWSISMRGGEDEEEEGEGEEAWTRHGQDLDQVPSFSVWT